MLFLHDIDGNLLDVNIASVKSTGFSREELLTMNVFDIDPDAKDRNDMQNYWKRLGPDDPPATFEGRHQRKDGTIYEAGISVSKVVIANKEYIMGLARDITKRKHAEEELKLAHKELQRMNETLEKKVIDRTEQIQLLLKQKDEFIHQLGHDLKNPLGPLVNLLPILDKRTTNQKDKEILEVIQRNVEYMKNLVKKTLELAQLNSPNTALNFEQVNLKNLVDDIIQQNSYLFETKHISILSNLSFDLIASVDVLRFEELMNNLISNAVKYTTENGSVVIDSFLKEDMLTISVQDTGKGMTSKQINHVFDEFYKADESRHNIESSGLGMPICKRIVEKHGGQIWVESNGVDKGSTFYFTLPLHQDVYGEVINKVDMLFKEN
jgi:PAS domain S-box-containing protein